MLERTRVKKSVNLNKEHDGMLYVMCIIECKSFLNTAHCACCQSTRSMVGWISLNFFCVFSLNPTKIKYFTRIYKFFVDKKSKSGDDRFSELDLELYYNI